MSDNNIIDLDEKRKQIEEKKKDKVHQDNPPWMLEYDEMFRFANKNKELSPIAHNALMILKYDPDIRGAIKWDKVMHRVAVTGGILRNCPNPDKFDNIITKAQDYIASSYKISIGREEIGRRISYVAEENEYDPLQEYLDSLVWNGEHILDRWLITYAGAEDTPYSRIVGRKWMLSCVARAYQPGCKADVVLVAEGDQGTHKSTLFKILGGPWYCEASGILGDKDSKQLIGAAWICELPDMASFGKTGRNAMKAFFTSAEDRYRPPYAKDTVSVKRRAVFGATTNDEEYLGDPTGNRRFHPVHLGEIDRAALIRDRDQLWAEAVAIYKAIDQCEDCAAMSVVIPGERPRCDDHSWWLTKSETVVANAEIELRHEGDSWTEKVLRFAKKPEGMDPDGSGQPAKLTTAAVLVNALNFDLKDVDRQDEMRVAAILSRAKYVRKRRGRHSEWRHSSEKSEDVGQTPTRSDDGVTQGPKSSISEVDAEIMQKLDLSR